MTPGNRLFCIGVALMAIRRVAWFAAAGVAFPAYWTLEALASLAGEYLDWLRQKEDEWEI